MKRPADTIEASFKVLDDMRKADVTDAELAESKTRVAGSTLTGLQTISQQATIVPTPYSMDIRSTTTIRIPKKSALSPPTRCER